MMALTIRCFAAVALACVFALPAAGTPAAGTTCRDQVPHGDWKAKDSLWWGHQGVSYAAYMPFETQAIPEPVTMDEDFGIIYFDLDKYNIRDSELGTLNTLAQWMRENPSETVHLEGHCCDLATDAYNLRLGQNRANSVKAWLVENGGIAPERISTVSYGKRRLVSPPPTRHLNRRVVTIIEDGR